MPTGREGADPEGAQTAPQLAVSPILPPYPGQFDAPLGVVLRGAPYSSRRNVTHVSEGRWRAALFSEARVDREDEGASGVAVEDPQVPPVPTSLMRAVGFGRAERARTRRTSDARGRSAERGAR